MPSDVVSGMRSGFVVGPSGTSQISERSQAAVRAHNHIRVIDRLAAIARMPHNRSSQQFNSLPFTVVLSDVRKATDPTDVDVAPIERSFSFQPGNIPDELRRNR